MPADVICISRALAAGGEDVARHVADKLGFRYVDDEILITAAEKQHLDPDRLAQEEQRPSGLRRVVDEFVSGGTLGEALRESIRHELARTAAEGQVVIVAHGASIALAGSPGLLRVLVTGSEPVRAERFAASQNVPADHATNEIRSSDRSRADYLRRFYDAEEQPAAYDLVVNTDHLSTADAAGLVLAAANALTR